MTTITERIATATGATLETEMYRLRVEHVIEDGWERERLLIQLKDGAIMTHDAFRSARMVLAHGEPVVELLEVERPVTLNDNNAGESANDDGDHDELTRLKNAAKPAHTFAVGGRVEAACDITEAMLMGGDEDDAVFMLQGAKGLLIGLARQEHSHYVEFDEHGCWFCDPAWLRPATADALDAWNPEPREGGQVLADDITDMPTVWAHEHAVVVAERDAAVAELARWKAGVAAARAEIEGKRNMYIALTAEHDPTDYVTLHIWKGKENMLREVLDVLPDGEA